MTDKPEAVAWRYMLANGAYIVDTWRRVRFNGEPVFDETPLYAHPPQPDASALVEALRVAEGALRHAPYRNTRTLQALERVSAALSAWEAQHG